MMERGIMILVAVLCIAACSGKKSSEGDTSVDSPEDTSVTDTTADTPEDTTVTDTTIDTPDDTAEDTAVEDTVEDTGGDPIPDLVEDTITDTATDDAGDAEDAIVDPVIDTVEEPDVVEDVAEEDGGGACDTSSPLAGCESTGGTESTFLCCESTSDWPNLCATGPCGCAPAYSHEVKVCVCPSSMCFDGSCCVPL